MQAKAKTLLPNSAASRRNHFDRPDPMGEKPIRVFGKRFAPSSDDQIADISEHPFLRITASAGRKIFPEALVHTFKHGFHVSLTHHIFRELTRTHPHSA